MPLSLTDAQTILTATLSEARSKAMNPLAIVILDARGAVKLSACEDGTSLKRGDIARGKAMGAISLGVGSRAIARMTAERPHFISAATHAIGGALIPVPGGVLIRDAGNAVIGSIGVSGDTSDNDELAAMAGIAAAGLKGDPGA
ncbi:MAG: heme-binding protein [Hyphomicrobiales bacterium]|nr:heme-binding protein [Hyphomicrobiales bacterium]